MVNTVNLNKTHCDYGHEFTEENTHRTARGWRVCKTCRRERGRRYAAEGRAKAARAPQSRARRQAKALRILGLPAAFWANAHCEDQGYRTPCLVWTGTIASNGYGVFTIAGYQHKAHRLSYEAVNGPIPLNSETGRPFHMDHQCHNDDPTCPGGVCMHRRCINPDHVEPVTAGVNVLRGKSFAAVNARKTHCVNGHEFTEANTSTGKGGSRVCLECKRASNRKHEAGRTERRRAERAAYRAEHPPPPKPPKPVKPPRELAPCGTLAARLRHVRKGEPIDAACRAAHAENMRNWKASRGATPSA